MPHIRVSPASVLIFREPTEAVRAWHWERGIRPVTVCFRRYHPVTPPAVESYSVIYYMWIADPDLAFEFKMRFG